MTGPVVTEAPAEALPAENRRLAHAYCIVEREAGLVRGLCHSPMLGKPMTPGRPICQVCWDLIDHHRSDCAPCMAEWGPRP